MEESSVLFCKRCTPWRGLLLTACLLTSWHLSTTAPVTVESVPRLVGEGDNVLFLVHGLPENIVGLAWFKGLRNMKQGIAIYVLDRNLSEPGTAHSGRETIYHNGSLLLRNINEKDAGFYTLWTYGINGQVISTSSLYLDVKAFLWKCGSLGTSVKLTVESVPPRVAEGESVLLLIHNPPENILGFFWFKGMAESKNMVAARFILYGKSTVWGPAYSGRETLHSDGSLLIHSVTKKDHGLYTLRILRTDTESEYVQVQFQVDTSLSLSCNPFSSSQLKIQPVPQYADEGEDVFLQVQNLPKDLLSFSWYKLEFKTPGLRIVDYRKDRNSILWGPAYRKRGMVYNNVSLMLHDVTEKDAGIYTLSVINKDFKVEEGYVEFHVKKYVTQPFVQITDNTVTGGTSVIFTCISPDSDTSIRWIFDKQNLQLTERMTLSPTKCGLKIDPVRSEDAGEYQCEVSNRFSSKTSLPVSWP